MADNGVIANPGAGGATFASDQIGGIEYPRSKLVWGADGTATDASAAAPLPTVQTGALPAGANNIGDVDVLSLPAIPAGTNNIGDVDVLTVPADPFGANADAASATGSISAKLRQIAVNGIPVTNGGVWSTQENLTAIAGTATDVNSGNKSAGTLRVVLATDQPALTNKLLVTPDSVALPANQSVNQAQIAGTATSVNSGTKDAGTQRVVIATDQPALTTPMPTKEQRAATSAITSVGDSATNVTLLASNANRLGATIANDSTATLRAKLGATASLTSYTVPIVAGAYYEVPFGYTGIIDGIWDTDPNTGSARVTELTA